MARNGLDSLVIGSYTTTYTATDSSGNQATRNREWSIIDTTPPVIFVDGKGTPYPCTVPPSKNYDLPDAVVHIEAGRTNPWDPRDGVGLCDAADEGRTSMSVTVTGFGGANGVSGENRVKYGGRDNLAIGELALTYTAVDGSGNRAEVSRTLVVRDTTPPVLTVNAAVSLQYGAPLEPWSSFSATDLYWSRPGEVTSEVKGVPSGLESGIARPGPVVILQRTFLD